jgi:hypothetical protein
VDKALHEAGIEPCFAELRIREGQAERFGLFAQIGEEAFFPTIGAAVSGYLRSAVSWVDWDDLVSQNDP